MWCPSFVVKKGTRYRYYVLTSLITGAGWNPWQRKSSRSCDEYLRADHRGVCVKLRSEPPARLRMCKSSNPLAPAKL
jgi:hypothetical protein